MPPAPPAAAPSALTPIAFTLAVVAGGRVHAR